MDYRILGRTGIQVAPLALGTDNFMDPTPADESARIMEMSLDAGINLIDSGGIEFLPEDFKGKWNMLFFGFTFCPDICPITMSMLSRIEKGLDIENQEKIRIFLVTVDPDRDSPDQLKVYLENFSENFIGLTGGLDQIYNFAYFRALKQL